SAPPPHRPSSPTRRSSDLVASLVLQRVGIAGRLAEKHLIRTGVQAVEKVEALLVGDVGLEDRARRVEQFNGETRYAVLVAVQFRSEEHTSELQSPDHLVCR